MLKKTVSILGFVALLTGLTAVQAEQNSHLFAGTNVGLADTGWTGANSTGIGFAGKVGYHFTNTWSVEGQFNHFADTSGVGTESISTNALSVLGKASLPIANSKFRAFAGFGLANMFTSGASDTSHLGYEMTYGVSLPISATLTVSGAYTLFQGSYTSNTKTTIPNATFYNIGVTYLLPENLFN